jgi:transposase-like protein
MRKAVRPPKEQLLKEIEELGYCGTGRKYGVSDNAIRKWLKKY